MTEVKIEDFNHLMLCMQYVGARSLLNDLEEAEKRFPKMPGLGFAIATAKVHVSDEQSRMLARNLALACKNGFDPDEQTLTMQVRDGAVWLVAEKQSSE